MSLNRPTWLMTVLLAVSSGCVSFSRTLEPTNPLIADTKHAQVCEVIVFAFGGHDHDVAPAMRQGGITKLRSAEYRETTFMGCGNECVVVHGE